MVEVNVHGGDITLQGTNIDPEKRFYTDAGICVYGRGVYLYNRTNRYWHNSARGNVVELRNYQGRKVGEAGTKEIETYDPKYWGDMERQGYSIPEKVKDFFNKVKRG